MYVCLLFIHRHKYIIYGCNCYIYLCKCLRCIHYVCMYLSYIILKKSAYIYTYTLYMGVFIIFIMYMFIVYIMLVYIYCIYYVRVFIVYCMNLLIFMYIVYILFAYICVCMYIYVFINV
jgi:hypothetical protein